MSYRAYLGDCESFDGEKADDDENRECMKVVREKTVTCEKSRL